MRPRRGGLIGNAPGLKADAQQGAGIVKIVPGGDGLPCNCLQEIAVQLLHPISSYAYLELH